MTWCQMLGDLELGLLCAVCLCYRILYCKVTVVGLRLDRFKRAVEKITDRQANEE